jgi:hypothetical protein
MSDPNPMALPYILDDFLNKDAELEPKGKTYAPPTALKQKIESMTDAELNERGIQVRYETDKHRTVFMKRRVRLKNKPLPGAVHKGPKAKNK